MYKYIEAVKADVKQYIEDEINLEEYRGRRDELEERLNDDLWIEDSVTGNGSGEYTSTDESRKYVLEDAGTVLDSIKDFCISAETIGEKFLNGDWIWFDVTARCYVLGSAIYEILEELEADGAFDEIKEEEAENVFVGIGAAITEGIENITRRSPEVAASTT